MDYLTSWKIRYKYKNNIFPRLSYILINFINDNHMNYLNLLLSPNIKLKDLIYYLRTKEINSELDLLNETIRYIELKHGIFK